MTIHDLNIGFKQAIVSDINQQLLPDSFVCLIGRNGTGKSTLLKTLAGILSPLSGNILLDGKELSSFTPAERAQKIGLVLTQVPDLPNTTLRELVAYGRLPYSSWLGRLTDTDWQIADDAIRQMGISNLTKCRIGELSDGERQKGMIARALAQETKYLLLDEPSAFLDHESKQELMLLLRSLAHNNHKTILLSTHDLELANQYADSLWKIQEGHLSSVSPW